VAIGLNGETLIGEERVKIILEAVKKFGRGNFAVRKIGYDYELRWR
jgi:molybdenum-dependent DNA-binding transcriptional regulator ModE